MRRALLVLTIAVAAPWALVGAQVSAPDLATLLANVGAAVEQYYARAQSVVCLETVTVQSVGRDLLSDRSPSRRLQYELRVAWEPGVDGGTPEATAQRELIKVNNRAPRPKDKPACTDPSDADPDALAFLLPANQADYSFTVGGRDKLRGRPALTLNFRGKKDGPVDVREKEGIENCVSFEIPEAAFGGRVWIDEATGSVLRIDQSLRRRIDIRIPSKIWKPWQVDQFTLERHERTAWYSPVSFSDPDETLMLPSSVQKLSVSTNNGERTMTTLSNYRRYTGAGRIVVE